MLRKSPSFGLWFIEELARHGYKLSPGTLYPLLHGLEEKGYLRSIKEREGRELASALSSDASRAQSASLPRDKRSANFSASC